MDKIWLKSYRAGVPAEIDLNEYTSLNDVLAKAAANSGISRPSAISAPPSPTPNSTV
jgi:hypothetical protein